MLARGWDFDVTSWGGPFILVTGDFERAESRILVAARPVSPEETVAEVFAFTPRRGGKLLAPLVQFLSSEVRRLFTQAFMKHDEDRLPGVAYRPQCLLPSERELTEFFCWLVSLPPSRIQIGDGPGTAPSCGAGETASRDGVRDN